MYPVGQGKGKTWFTVKRRGTGRSGGTEKGIYALDPEIAEALDKEHKCKKAFRDAEDKLVFVEYIIKDDSISAIKRAKLIHCCTDTVFFPLRFYGPSPKEHISSIDWSLVEEILDVEEDFLIGDEICRQSYEDHLDWNYCLDQNTVNQTIVSAALGKTSIFEICMDNLMDDVRRNAEWKLKNNTHWSHLVSLQYYNELLLYARSGLMHIGKPSWILPYLIRFAKGWEAYAEEKEKDFDKRPFFSLYQAIADCADEASREKNVPPQYQMDFDDIWCCYQEYMDDIAGINYILRYDKE